jgi:hypothetical protein
MLTWLKQDPSWVKKVLHWQYPGHWLIEENSTATAKPITGFFEKCIKIIQLAGIILITALNVASLAPASPRVWEGDPCR